MCIRDRFIGGDVVNTHTNELKNCLLKIIDDMALSSDIFNLSGKPAFCRKSKFNFSTLIQFIDVYKRQDYVCFSVPG